MFSLCSYAIDELTSPPEVFKPRRRQLGVPDRMLNRAVAKPVLNGPGVVPGVRQCVAAAVAQHVHMDRKSEARGGWP